MKLDENDILVLFLCASNKEFSHCSPCIVPSIEAVKLGGKKGKKDVGLFCGV